MEEVNVGGGATTCLCGTPSERNRTIHCGYFVYPKIIIQNLHWNFELFHIFDLTVELLPFQCRNKRSANVSIGSGFQVVPSRLILMTKRLLLFLPATRLLHSLQSPAAVPTIHHHLALCGPLPNPPGLKGCRGRVQLSALLTLHFLCKAVQRDFGVKCLLFCSLSASVSPLFSQRRWGRRCRNASFTPLTLLSHLSITVFLGSCLGTQTHQQKCDARLLPAAGNGTVLAAD